MHTKELVTVIEHCGGSTLESAAGSGEEVRQRVHERRQIARAAERRVVASCARRDYAWVVNRGDPISHEEAAFLTANR